MTLRVALLGKPLRRRHSQVMHDAAFAAAGIDARYVLRELEADEVEAAVAEARGPDWLGLGVTAPYKRVVAGLCDEVEAEATAIGAVNNAVRTADGRLVGFNSDAPGFRAGVELAMGRPLAGADVAVAGAGGAAHAVVFACLSAGARSVTIGNRTASSAAALAARFSGVGTGSVSAVALDDAGFGAALGSADLAVNATTVGMLDAGLTIGVDLLRDDATVFDLVYVPPETPLLRGRPCARSAGSERVRDAHRPGRDRVRALDRGGRHGRRHARRRGAAARRRRRARLTMRLATIVDDGRPHVVAVRGTRYLPLATASGLPGSLVSLAAAGPEALRLVSDWVDRQHDGAWQPLGGVPLAAAVPQPGAIYTIGLNYRSPGEAAGAGPDRPLVYGKAATSVAAHGASLSWDRSLTANVDPECELGVVIGAAAWAVPPEDALDHVFGFTIVNDVSSRDPWLDGDQWLVGKSMPGFCPAGPVVVTAEELDPSDLRLGCTINGAVIQDGRTSAMRFPIADVISYLSRHVALRPGDLVATGTPPRLASPPGPDRHLEAGDVVTAWIEGIGELTTRIA